MISNLQRFDEVIKQFKLDVDKGLAVKPSHYLYWSGKPIITVYEDDSYVYLKKLSEYPNVSVADLNHLRFVFGKILDKKYRRFTGYANNLLIDRNEFKKLSILQKTYFIILGI